MIPITEPPPGDEDGSEPSRAHTQDLLDFVIRYETDRMQGGVLTLPQYQALFPRSHAAIADEFHSLQGVRARDTNDWTQRHARFDHYVIEREIGRGGQGRVFLAFDTCMRRRVALKVLSRANLSPDTLRRFQREVEIIAKLEHPGLCSVFEANLSGREPYLVMRYVEGEDLARQIRGAKEKNVTSGIVGARTAVDLARLLQLFERAARALHAAHEAGIVHRDVKPANIIVNATGEPVIVDFGLARNDDSESATLTRTDDVLGTPAYMAPELLESGHSSVDRRADVYALGVALYECLTLERPFGGATREGVFEQIRHGVYANPRERNTLVSEDLRVVLATAMEVDPSRRYSGALDLAEDLRRVREYEPIRARPANWPIRLRRWAQRHPRLAAVFAGVIAVVGATLVTLTATVKRVEAESARTRAANERLRGVAFRERSNDALSSNAGLALRFAIEAEKRDPGFESNMTLLRALGSSHEQRTFWPGFENELNIYDACLNDHGAIVATKDGLHFFALDDSKPRMTVPTSLTKPHGLQSAPDGSRIAVLSDAEMDVFDGESGALLYKYTHSGTTAESCDFSSDSRWLVTSARNGVARVFDARDGTLLRTLTPGTGMLTLARFDPSGRFIVTASDLRADSRTAGPSDFDPRLWNAGTGEPVAVLVGHESGVRGALFTADGEALVTVCIDGSVRCWKTADATLSWRQMLPGAGWSVGISPDGRRVVAGFDSGARVFDIVSGDAPFDLEGLHERPVVNVTFSPDGRHIAANDYGGVVGAWYALDGSCSMMARCESTGGGGIEWMSNSTRFVSWSGGTVAHVWTTRRIPFVTSWHSHTRVVRSCVFSPSSTLVLSAGEDGRIELRTADEGALIRGWELGSPLERAWFVADDESIAILARDGRVFRLDRDADPAPGVATAGHAIVCSSETSRDGSTVLVGFDDGRVAWIDARDSRTLFEARNGCVEINVVAISPDGTRAAWCSDDGFGGAIDRTSGLTISFRLDAPTQHMHALAFDPDGARILGDSDALMISTIRFENGARQETHKTRPLSAMVPLGGERLLTAFKWVSGVCLQGSGRDVEPWPGSPYGAPGRFLTLRVDAKEELALAASTAGYACLWRVRDGELIVRYDHGSAPLTCAEFSPDGRAVVTASEDGSVHVWPIDLRGTALAHVPAPAEVWQSRFPKVLDDE